MVKYFVWILFFGNILLTQAVFLNFPFKWTRLWSAIKPPKRCYGELGCIHLTNDWFDPVHRPINKFPESREVINCTFTLYTTTNSIYDGSAITADENSILYSDFDPNMKTKFIIHGYIDTATVSWVHEMKDEILKREGAANIIAVDWTGGSQSAYPQSAANTRIVGLEIAHMIRKLMNTTNLNLEDVHLIGHSLGAQSASYAAKSLKGIGRISALDPASFLFQGMGAHIRLHISDAKFVDVIHTDSGHILDFKVPGYGMYEAVGHLDFYPNNGESQPGCELMKKGSFISEKTLDLMGRQLVACSHDRSIRLFIDSINGACPYLAHRCSSYRDFLSGRCFDCKSNDCAIMGYHSIKPISEAAPLEGKYYLTTGQSPYCQKHYKFSIELKSSISIRGKLSATLRSNDTEMMPISIDLTPMGAVLFNGFYSIVQISEVPYDEITDSVELHWKSESNFLGLYCMYNCNNALYVKSIKIEPMQSVTEDFKLMDNPQSTRIFTTRSSDDYEKISPSTSTVFYRS